MDRRWPIRPCAAPARGQASVGTLGTVENLCMALLNAALAPLTPAEQRVLDQLILGLSNKAIAAALVLSPRTVESHVSHILAKTQCRSRSQLLLLALGSGTAINWSSSRETHAGLAQW